ncbi:MAG: hypothetical protein EPO02_08150 [Nitrospirae bacterium]|nr:MAG: hypothetical protein EPO02_08150 [Nitrospirota bacterium]
MRLALRALGLAMGVFLIAGAPGSDEAGIAGPPAEKFALPAEPDEFDRREVDAYYDWRNNMFFRVFKMTDREGKPDYMTARRTYKASVNQYGYEVAITFSHPLFYWVDVNGDGEFEPAKGEMWIDIEEDGVNGNERLYDPMAPGEAPRGPVPAPPKPPGKPGGHL